MVSHTGFDALDQIPTSRWDTTSAANQLAGSTPEVASRIRHGGFLATAELFRASAFGVSAAEAAAMDPQQRLLLELGYATLHGAGLLRASLLGSVIAVNVGQWASEFGNVLTGLAAGSSVYASTGFSCSVTCGRVSFVLGLQGPCASFDTACSASLVASHTGAAGVAARRMPNRPLCRCQYAPGPRGDADQRDCRLHIASRPFAYV